MGFPSPNAASASGSLPIGSSMWVSKGMDPLITCSDGSVWLRSGLAVAPTQFPEAAKLRHLQIFGAPSTLGPTLNLKPVSIATDGAGNFIAVASNDTQVYVSTDGGDTWTAYAANLPVGSPCSCAYGNGNWVLVGCGTSSIYTSYRSGSPAGAFTAGSTVATTSTVSDSAKVVYAGGANFFIAANGTNAACGAISSNSGASFTAKSLSAAVNAGTAFPHIASDGAGKLMVVARLNSGDFINYSTDYGVTWASAAYSGTSLAACSGAAYFNSQMWFLTADGKLAYSTNGSSISGTVAIPVGDFSAVGILNSAGLLCVIAGKLTFPLTHGTSLMTGAWQYDGTNFTTCQFSAAMTFSGSYGGFSGDSSGRFVAVSSGSAYAGYGNLTSPSAIGSPSEALIGNGSAVYANLYYKVKE